MYGFYVNGAVLAVVIVGLMRERAMCVVAALRFSQSCMSSNTIRAVYMRAYIVSSLSFSVFMSSVGAKSKRNIVSTYKTIAQRKSYSRRKRTDGKFVHENSLYQIKKRDRLFFNSEVPEAISS